MGRFLRTAWELMTAWFFPGPDDDVCPPGMYAVVWAERWEGNRLAGKRELLACSTELWEALQFMNWSGAAVLHKRGGRGVVATLAPEGFPVREFERETPAERAASILERVRARSLN